MKIFTGIVLGKKMTKTVTVVVERVVIHPVYKKRVRLTKKYQVHDETDAVVGQKVKFAPSRPYSKTKRWKIIGPVKEETKKSQVVKKEPKGRSNK